jgi:DNA-binding CsgD family transcriptional regulator
MERRGDNDFKESAGTSALPDAGSDPADSDTPSLETALKSPLGRKLPPIMRMIASKRVSGETVEQIAKALGIGRALVNSYLRHVVSTLRCQPSAIYSNELENTPEGTKRTSSRAGELSSEELMIEAECESCGKQIEGDEERVLAAAMALNYFRDHDEGRWLDYEVRLHVGKALHYCLECAGTTEELRIPNPWFVSEEQRRAMAKYIAHYHGAEVAKTNAQDGILRKALARGDIRAFNTAMPTRPERSEVMARAIPVSRVAAKIAAGMDEPTPASEIAEQLFANDEGWEKVAAAQSARSGERAQRAKLSEYLNSLQSRGKMLPGEREAARMWAADGLSENEIARRQGVNQSTVHRRVDAAKRKASAQR